MEIGEQISLTLHADEETQRFYVWSADEPDVPPVHAKHAGKALEYWLDDLRTHRGSKEE